MPLVKQRKESPDKTNISHPYPPSYRSNPSPDQFTSNEHLNLHPTSTGQGYNPRSMGTGPSPSPSPSPLPLASGSRSRSPDDPTIPLTAGLVGLGHAQGRGVDEDGSKEVLGSGPGPDGVIRDTAGNRVDAQGIVLPENWTKEDEEAEREFLRKGLFDWKALMGWRYWIRKEWWGKSCLYSTGRDCSKYETRPSQSGVVTEHERDWMWY